MSKKEIPIENIYYMLIYAWKKLKESGQINIDQINRIELINLLASVFLSGLEYLIKRNLDRNYILFSEDTRHIRGKFDFAVSIKRNLIKKVMLHCSFDEMSYNVIHNQIIKTMIMYLLRFKDLDDDIRKKLRTLYFYFNEVSTIELNKKVFRTVRLNHNNYYYDFLLKISELIYDNALFDEDTGKYKFYNFLENNMANIFENFVRNFYKIELPKELPDVDVKGSEQIKWDISDYDENSMEILPQMQTDTSIVYEKKKLIIDTKFYIEALKGQYDKKKLISNNLYQIFAYVKNSEKEFPNCQGMLLYPKVDKDIDVSYVIQEHKIMVRTINLNQKWEQIYKDLIDIVSKEIV